METMQKFSRIHIHIQSNVKLFPQKRTAFCTKKDSNIEYSGIHKGSYIVSPEYYVGQAVQSFLMGFEKHRHAIT